MVKTHFHFFYFSLFFYSEQIRFNNSSYPYLHSAKIKTLSTREIRVYLNGIFDF